MSATPTTIEPSTASHIDRDVGATRSRRSGLTASRAFCTRFTSTCLSASGADRRERVVGATDFDHQRAVRRAGDRETSNFARDQHGRARLRRRIARAIQVEHLLRELVHAQQLVDRQIRELDDPRVLRRPAANELEQVAQIRDRISNLVRELADEPRARREAIALHEIRLQRAEPRVAIGERFVCLTQLGHPAVQRASHLAKLLGDARDLVDARRRQRCVERALRHRAGGVPTVGAPGARCASASTVPSTSATASATITLIIATRCSSEITASSAARSRVNTTVVSPPSGAVTASSMRPPTSIALACVSGSASRRARGERPPPSRYRAWSRRARDRAPRAP